MVSFRHASVHMYCACLRVGGWVVRGLRFFCGVLFFDQKRGGGATLHDMFDAMAFHAHYGSLACAFCVGRCSCVMMLARGVDVRVQTLSKQLERMLISSCWRGGRWLSFGLQVMRSFRCKCSTALAQCFTSYVPCVIVHVLKGVLGTTPRYFREAPRTHDTWLPANLNASPIVRVHCFALI